MNLWEKIEKQIKNKQTTVYALSKKADIAENTLYELKKGRSKDLMFETVCKIADALGVSLDEFRPHKDD